MAICKYSPTFAVKFHVSAQTTRDHIRDRNSELCCWSFSRSGRVKSENKQRKRCFLLPASHSCWSEVRRVFCSYNCGPVKSRLEKQALWSFLKSFHDRRSTCRQVNVQSQWDDERGRQSSFQEHDDAIAIGVGGLFAVGGGTIVKFSSVSQRFFFHGGQQWWNFMSPFRN